jgi:hypothetical protein
VGTTYRQVVMRCYHRTDAADAILAEGWRDMEGTYLTKHVYRGVWVSNTPLDVNEGAVGEAVLLIDVPDELFAEYEWVEEGKGCRESLIPAALLNELPKPRKVEVD